jgi:hypothetical protein
MSLGQIGHPVPMVTITSVVRASVRVLFLASCVALTGCATHHAKTGSAATSSTTAHATHAQNNPSLPVSFNGARWTFSVRLQAGYLGVCVSAKRSVSGGSSTALFVHPNRAPACFRANDDPMNALEATVTHDTATHTKLAVELGGASVARIEVVSGVPGRATITEVGAHVFFVLYPDTTDLQRVTSFDEHGKVTAIGECLHGTCP